MHLVLEESPRRPSFGHGYIQLDCLTECGVRVVVSRQLVKEDTFHGEEFRFLGARKVDEICVVNNLEALIQLGGSFEVAARLLS